MVLCSVITHLEHCVEILKAFIVMIYWVSQKLLILFFYSGSFLPFDGLFSYLGIWGIFKPQKYVMFLTQLGPKICDGSAELDS